MFSAAYNHDGTKLVCSVTLDPFVQVLDIATNTFEAWAPTSDAPTGDVLSARFSPDGTMIATCGSATGSQSIRIWEYPSGNPVFVYTGSPDIYDFEFSPDGSQLFISTTGSVNSSQFDIYETATWTKRSVSFPTTWEGSHSYSKIVWFDNRFVFASWEGGCGVLDTDDDSVVMYMQYYASSMAGASPSPLTQMRKIAGTVTDGSAGALNRTVRAFDSATGAFLGESESDAVTGEFEFFIFSGELCTVYALGEGTEEAQIFDKVTPAAIT